MENKVSDSDYIGYDVQQQTRSEFKDTSEALAWRKVFFCPSGCDQWGGVGERLAQLNISESAISFMKYSSAVLERMY